MDAIANLACSLVATAPSPADSGTSLGVTAGTGVRYPVPPFEATAHPVDQVPTPANAEMVTVTERVTDTLTIVRAQGGTVARAIAIGWQLAATVGVKLLNELDRDRAPATDVSLVANHTAVYPRRLTVASGKRYAIGLGAAVRVV
jgi:hypothetical protein